MIIMVRRKKEKIELDNNEENVWKKKKIDINRK